MEENKTPVEALLERGQAYINTTLQLFKLKATDKGAEIISKIASGFVILILIVLLFMNLNIAVALLIGDMLGKLWLGFLVLSGFYAFTGVVVYLFRDRLIKRPVSNSIISEMLKEDDFSEDDLSD